MRYQDSVKAIRHKEVYVLKIGLMRVYYSKYFHYLLKFFIDMLSLDEAWNLLVYLGLSIMRCISAELLYLYQPVGVCIEKWFPY